MEGHTDIGKILPHVVTHLGNANGMIRMGVDIPDLDAILLLVHQHIVAGFDTIQVVIRAEVNDFTKNEAILHNRCSGGQHCTVGC